MVSRSPVRAALGLQHTLYGRITTAFVLASPGSAWSS